MEKHIPGPWFVTGSRMLYVETRISSGLIQEIAAIGPTAADNRYGQHQQANARLIAAAPDLLQALQDLADDISDRFDMNSPSTNPGIKNCISAARIAIAKAIGE